jgi:hypothetical protein
MESEKILPIPKLEMPCERCEGLGWNMSCGERERCGVCDGAGFVPTEDGEKVLSLMRHNFRPLYQDLTKDL